MSNTAREIAAKEADQLELLAMASGPTATSLESGLLDNTMAEFDEDAPQPPGSEATERFAEDQMAQEDLAGSALEEVAERKRLLGGAYPFSIEGAALTYMPGENLVYEFCLLASLQDHSRKNAANTSRLMWSSGAQIGFELLALECSKLYLNGDGLRTGWPTHDSRERPTSFEALCSLLQSRSGEIRAGSRPSNVPYFQISPEDQKDAKLDFVVWRKLDDRPGSVHLFGQCACGQNWATKTSELQLKVLSAFFELPPADIIRVFALPRVITKGDDLDIRTREGGLILDRIRLCKLADGAPDTHIFRAGWRPSMLRYIERWRDALLN